MTVSRTYTAQEEAIPAVNNQPASYRIQLLDSRGNVLHTSKGKDRATCILGLQNFGFTVTEGN